MPMAIAPAARLPAFRFAAAGLAWGLAFFGTLRIPWVEAHAVLPLTRLQGRVAAFASGLPVLPVDVTLACSGVDVMALCVGAVLGYPAPRRARAIGAAAGLLLILVLNTLRIGSLGLTVASPRLFAALHLFVWPAVLVIAVASYVFWWMRRVERSVADPVEAWPLARRPHVRHAWFVTVAVAGTLALGAATSIYMSSVWVLALTDVVTRAGAGLLPVLGVEASAAGNVLTTARGRFQVTPECIVTPLIPVYVAAAVAYAGTWRRAGMVLALGMPLFMLLGIARLLVIALPAAIAGSPLVLIHAFSQLLTACLLVCAAAWWQGGLPRQVWLRAAAGLVFGAICLRLLDPMEAYLLPLAPRLTDAQQAMALLPAFQIAFAGALWVAASAPRGWRRFGLGIAVLAASQVAILSALNALAFTPGVPSVRAWAIVAPLIVMAGMVDRGRARA